MVDGFMSADTMTTWGFWITVFGTVISVISFFLTIWISNNTAKIKKKFMDKHLEEKYRKSKRSIIIQLHTSYRLLKEDERLDVHAIEESIISLSVYEDILTRTTKSKLKKIDKKINSKALDKKDEIRRLLYEVIKRLENELDEHTRFVEEVSK